MSSASDALSSRLESLVIRQNPPFASEVALARTIVSKGKVELQKLKAAIAELKRQEKVLQDHIDKHERIVFSINRLPTELLSLIFLFGVPSVPLEHSPRAATTQSPWLVSQVCKLWRQIALSSQLLWAFPIVFPPTQSPGQLKLHLERAGNAGLHPHLVGSPRGRIFPTLLASILECSPRWVTLSMHFDWTPLQVRLAALSARVAQLEKLKIEGVWGDDITTALGHGQRLTAFTVAPRLRSLDVTRVCEPAVSLLLPWSQLTEYRACGSAHEHTAVLKICPNLIKLDLAFSATVTIAADAPVQVVLPRLTHLRIGDAAFLGIIGLPALRDIVIQRTDPDSDALLPLLQLIRRDRPPLRDVSLVHSALVTPTLASILQDSPAITMLRIHVQRGDTAAVDALLVLLTLAPGAKHATECLAPALAEIELSGRGTFDQARFVEMVESRWRGCVVARIQRVVLRTGPKSALTPETMERLRVLMKEGMHATTSLFVFCKDDIDERT
ncbi:hypothetical protein C8R46DRAFT_1346953 [Mycena filopes]|nr:hypothetical protein C8R46DRAFT_1346953 [Mycena filopes]